MQTIDRLSVLLRPRCRTMLSYCFPAFYDASLAPTGPGSTFPPTKWSPPVLVPTALEPLFPFGGLAKTERGGTVMRIFILAALLIAAFALPAHAVEPVKSAAKGTATVAKGAAKGTATVAKGAAK